VVVAQDPAAAAERVLAKPAGLLILSQRPQAGSEVVGRVQGIAAPFNSALDRSRREQRFGRR
jgi:hypothetical protein